MPLDTEVIDLATAAAFEAGAAFFSRLAYPTPAEAGRRKFFNSALVRWALLYDEEWSSQVQHVRPKHFAIQETGQWDKTWNAGYDRLLSAEVVADMIGSRLLHGAWSKSVNRTGPDFASLVAVAMENFGTENHDTFVDDYWRACRPVLHAWIVHIFIRPPGEYGPTNIDAMYQCMRNVDHLSRIVRVSELVRGEISKLSGLTKYKLREGDTVMFAAK